MPSYDSKIFAVGDIHGCYDKLAALLKQIPLNRDQDIIVFLGDYINRGPDSKKVIDALIELSETCTNTIFLKGNHEQMLLEYAATGDVETLRILRTLGIEATAESYGCRVRHLSGLAGLPERHRDFLHNLEFSYTFGKYLFVHADANIEILNSQPIPEDLANADYISQTSLLSSRRLIDEHERIEGYTVVFGHTPFAVPLVTEDRICIDTGAVYGNVLTALELPAFRFYHT